MSRSYANQHRSGNCLDLLFTDSPGVVAASVGTPMGTSDHSAICAIIKTKQAMPDVSFSCKIYHEHIGMASQLIFLMLTGPACIICLILFQL